MVDPYASNRQFERFLESRLEVKAGKDPFIFPNEEELLVTVIYNLNQGTVEYQYPDGRTIKKRA